MACADDATDENKCGLRRHKCRHSASTVSKILNHVESGITAVYDRHSYDAEKRHALDLWGSYVERVAAGKHNWEEALRF